MRSGMTRGIERGLLVALLVHSPSLLFVVSNQRTKGVLVMSTVQVLLARGQGEVYSTSPTATVFDAIGKMERLNVGALVVIDHTQRLCGILTERDYLRKVALEGRASRTTFVQEIMTRDLLCVEPQTGLEECMKIMTEHRVRHLPVLRDSKLIGIVSIGDIVSLLAQERQRTIQELTEYIQGRYA